MPKFVMFNVTLTEGGQRLYLCCLLRVHSLIIRSGAICTNMHLYMAIMCKDGVVADMCPYLLPFSLNVHGCVFWQMCLHVHLACHLTAVCCLSISPF